MAVSALTGVGALLADKTRATILVALMDGRARTPGELARHAGVAASTISEHVRRLVDAGFLEGVAQGRHRYYRIAGDEVGLLLETIGGFDLPAGPLASPGRAGELRHVRSCYDHLAGELAVRLHDRLLERGCIERVDGALALTAGGADVLHELGAEWPASTRRPPVRACLDWTERRDHLAGPAAAGLLRGLLERRWLARGTRPRSLRVTERGRRGLADFL